MSDSSDILSRISKLEANLELVRRAQLQARSTSWTPEKVQQLLDLVAEGNGILRRIADVLAAQHDSIEDETGVEGAT